MRAALRERWEAFLNWLVISWFVAVLCVEWSVDRVRQWIQRG